MQFPVKSKSKRTACYGSSFFKRLSYRRGNIPGEGLEGKQKPEKFSDVSSLHNESIDSPMHITSVLKYLGGHILLALYRQSMDSSTNGKAVR